MSAPPPQETLQGQDSRKRAAMGDPGSTGHQHRASLVKKEDAATAPQSDLRHTLQHILSTIANVQAVQQRQQADIERQQTDIEELFAAQNRGENKAQRLARGQDDLQGQLAALRTPQEGTEFGDVSERVDTKRARTCKVMENESPHPPAEPAPHAEPSQPVDTTSVETACKDAVAALPGLLAGLQSAAGEGAAPSAAQQISAALPEVERLLGGGAGAGGDGAAPTLLYQLAGNVAQLASSMSTLQTSVQEHSRQTTAHIATLQAMLQQRQSVAAVLTAAQGVQIQIEAWAAAQQGARTAAAGRAAKLQAAADAILKSVQTIADQLAMLQRGVDGWCQQLRSIRETLKSARLQRASLSASTVGCFTYFIAGSDQPHHSSEVMWDLIRASMYDRELALDNTHYVTADSQAVHNPSDDQRRAYRGAVARQFSALMGRWYKVGADEEGWYICPVSQNARRW